MIEGLLYILTGILAGLLSGILGIGGGLIVVPALLMIFQHDPNIALELTMHLAAGTSLAIMIFTSISSIHAHQKAGDLLWPVYRRLAPGVAFGTFFGAIAASYMSTQWLKYLLMLVLFAVAVKMFFDRNQTCRPGPFPGFWINGPVSFVIGLKSGLLGIGGGLLIIPYLTYSGIEIRKIPGVSALCTLTVAVIGSLSFIITGWNVSGLPPFATGYVEWLAVICVAVPSFFAAHLGARLSYILPIKQLKYIFILILLLTVLSMSGIFSR